MRSIRLEIFEISVGYIRFDREFFGYGEFGYEKMAVDPISGTYFVLSVINHSKFAKYL